MTVVANWSQQSGKTATTITDHELSWISDVSPILGGSGDYPDPHQLLDSSLAACTILTLQIYVKRKGIQLQGMEVTVNRVEQSGLYQLQRHIELQGQLSDIERDDLLRVANKCPIHKILSGKIDISTELEVK